MIVTDGNCDHHQDKDILEGEVIGKGQIITKNWWQVF